MRRHTTCGAQYAAKPWLRSYPEDIPKAMEFPVKSPVEAFDEAVDRWRQRTALVFYGSEMSYGELRRDVDRLAAALHDIGIRKGSVVGILLMNSPQFVVAFYALLKVGAVVAPISPIYTSHEVKHQLEDTGTRAVICQDILYGTIERTGIRLDTVVVTSIGDYLADQGKAAQEAIDEKIAQKMELPTITDSYFDRPGFYHLMDLIKRYPAAPPAVERDPRQDLALISHSGGTTGLPKGIMITHYSMLASALCSLTWLKPDQGNETVVAYQPFYHMGGLTLILLLGILSGATNIVLITPAIDDVLELTEKHKASIFTGAPAMYRSLAGYPTTDVVDWKRLRAIISATDSLPESTAKAWESRTGTKLQEAYGLTETTGTGCSNVMGVEPRRGSLGIPMPGVNAAVIDPETDEFIPLGEIGELILQAPFLMKGYLNNQEETERTFVTIDGDRWFRTGDLVRMAEDGYIYFYDRKKDLIKYKGYSILAKEVEQAVCANPGVREAAVVGVTHPASGQIVKAVVVPTPDAKARLTEEDIMDWCRSRLANYKVPRVVEFRDELPKTNIGKVSRKDLRQAPGGAQ